MAMDVNSKFAACSREISISGVMSGMFGIDKFIAPYGYSRLHYIGHTLLYDTIYVGVISHA